MPEQQAIKQIIKKHFGENIVKIERMTMGIANEVYCVSLPSKQVIVRLNIDGSAMAGTQEHIKIFKSKGIAVPDILAFDYTKKFVPYAYQIYAKLPGQDIGQVIHKLSDKQLKVIAKEMVAIINKLKTVPTNGKFGVIGGRLKATNDTWLQDLQPTKVMQRNKKTGVVGKTYINMVHQLLKRYKDYFDSVKSTFYYDDMSSKNILIDQGKFVGIVDLDTMVYGDPLEAVGRIKASWYGTKYGQTYTEAVEKNLKLSKKQREMVTAYAFLNRVLWLSGKGIQFNKNTSTKIDQKAVAADRKVIDGLAKELEL